MKNAILSAIVSVFILVSCNQKSKEIEQEQVVEKEVIKDSIIEKDTISMVKIEPATKKDSVVVIKKQIIKTVKQQLYSCPMHPEVQDKKGAECSKCGMELTELVK